MNRPLSLFRHPVTARKTKFIKKSKELYADQYFSKCFFYDMQESYLSQKRFNPRSQRAGRNVTQNVAEEVAVGVWKSNIFVTTFCQVCGQSFQPESGCI